MTTIAYKQYTNIPYGGYVSAPVIGPLSTNRTPLMMPRHNYGELPGRHPNPPQFYPSDGASEFSNARRQYLRTRTTQYNMNTGTKMESNLPPTSVYSAGLQQSFLVSQSTKYNAPKCSSMYISAKKSAAVGKSSFKQGLPNDALLSYKNYNKNDVKTALKFSRAGGCVAPAKKGSIYNTSSCNGRVCAWGSLVSQTY